MLFVMVMAYGSNWSYALSSRSAMRNSNAYHLLAALVASLAFFVTFRYLFLRDMPITLFLAYLFATVLGSVHGQTISMFIEKRLKLDIIATKVEGGLHIREHEDGYKNQFFRFWPSVTVLLLAFVLEIAWLKGLDPLTIFVVVMAAALVGLLLFMVQRVIKRLEIGSTPILVIMGGLALGVTGHELFLRQPETFLLVAVLLLGVPDSFIHAVLRVARSSDHYWFHLTASLLKMAFGFLQLMIIYDMNFNWSLFLPMATGSMIGSLTGSTFAAEFAKRIKAGFDEHVHNKRDVGWPRVQLYGLIGIGVTAHLIAFGLYRWQGVLILLGLSFIQTMSFTLISRARQRKDKQYHAWASVCSNGVWYLTMQQLVLGKIMPYQAAPYVVGNVSGSLIGQGTALKVEKMMGAVMVERPEPKKTDQPARATT
jgi:hypothetical protein